MSTQSARPSRQKNSSPFYNSLAELFARDSKCSLLDYSQLNLLDTKQIKLLDTSQLKLVDAKQLNLIHIPAFLFFVQYIGMLGVVLSLGIASLFITPLTNSVLNEANRLAVDQKEVITRKRVVAYSVAGVASPRGNSFVEEASPKVAGASTEEYEFLSASYAQKAGSVLDDKSAQTLATSCSFVAQGNASQYASGGVYTKPSGRTVTICARYAGEVTRTSWKYENETVLSHSDCYTVDVINSGDKLSFETYDENSNLTGSCSLTLRLGKTLVSNNIVGGDAGN